ncbi:hypothetical protein CY652_13970 [Burkholderia sp. WAC0059]|uniref:hypothetical protein n=1 Tax=Burkholderia sp. WAC0059 TaxID=2066022 RepID=UPI000C7EE619|nr:hypothetical protein [Burkholderia sp. WAC0059]PLZ01777.1 hypothetical protein CY652_13970 [Burkholderia sp. WAC0059]
MPTSDRTQALEARLWNWGNAGRGPYDPADALIVTQAWERLFTRQREMLRMVYLWRVHREVVCRRLHIPRRPASLYELELSAACRALARALDIKGSTGCGEESQDERK